MEYFWSVIGKVTVILGAIAGVLRIYVYSKKSGPHLVLSYSRAKFSLPPDLSDALNKIRKVESEATKNILPYRYRYSNHGYEGHWIFIVQNLGDKTASDVALDIPEEGVGLISQKGQNDSVVEFRDSISLGSLRPDSEIQVSIWSLNHFSLYEEKGLRLTHSSGRGIIKRGLIVYGFTAWIVRNFYFIGALFVPIIFVAALGSIALFMPHACSKTARTSPSNETTIQK